MNKTEEIFDLTAPFDNPFQGNYKRSLFVCSAGLLRSATAAHVAAKLGHNTRNCGSASYALIPLSVNLIMWAHKIYFVNPSNFEEALYVFRFDPECVAQLKEKSVVWDIPDKYDFNNPELVEIIMKKLA